MILFCTNAHSLNFYQSFADSSKLREKMAYSLVLRKPYSTRNGCDGVAGRSIMKASTWTQQGPKCWRRWSARGQGENCVRQYVHATNWLSYSIPEYSRLVAPLRELLEKAHRKTGKRTRRSIANLALTGKLAWEACHQQAFDSLQASIAQSLKLAHFDASQVLCVHTDASGGHWAAVVTQICLLYTSPSPRDGLLSRMPSSA